MIEAEAKHRRLGPAAAAAAAADGDPGAGRELDSDGKRKAAGVSAARALFHRRKRDIVGLLLYAAVMTGGYSVADTELLRPPEATAVRLLRGFGLVILALHTLSWIGIVFHGPGRPPPGLRPGQDALLPDTLIRFLDSGRQCWDRPFSAEEGPCGKCGRWKPALANHCSTCARCSLWMDHHCMLAAQCIGFRNLRCFVVWLFYGHILIALLIVLSLRHLALFGGPDTRWAWARCAGWSSYIYALAYLLRHQLTAAILRVCPGWPSQVMWVKFKDLIRDAARLEKELKSIERSLTPESPERLRVQEVVDEIRSASVGIQRQDGGPILANTYRGPFTAASEMVALARVFGEPCSWRWLLPLVAGGTGDPVRPTAYDALACEAWIALSAAMGAGNEIMAQAQGAKPGQTHGV